MDCVVDGQKRQRLEIFDCNIRESGGQLANFSEDSLL